MAGPFDFLHIKGHTKGSSNELSFDVLDAVRMGKKTEADTHTPELSFDVLDAARQSDPARHGKGKHGLAKHQNGTANASDDNYTASAASHVKDSPLSGHRAQTSSPLATMPEVERRKRLRRSRSARLWAIAALAVAVLLGAGGYFGIRYYQNTVDFKGHYNAVIERYKQIDKDLVEIDTLMNDVLATQDAESRTSASKNFTQLTRDLNAVQAEVESMTESAVTDADRAALSAATSAAQARKDMLEKASAAFSLSKEANQLADQANVAWNDVLTADNQARQASEAANAARTQEATTQAKELTSTVRESFKSALTKLQEVEKKRPSLSLSTEKDYVSKRIEALDAALKTADALLANDRAAAETANTKYNELDHQAVELASKITSGPGQHVLESYSSQLEDIEKEYQDARHAASTADATIRTYL